jgi:hypothetical protein
VEVYWWFEVVGVIPDNTWILFESFLSFINRGKNVSKLGIAFGSAHGIGLSVLRTRNHKIFSNKVHTFGEVMNRNKCTSWK